MEQVAWGWLLGVGWLELVWLGWGWVGVGLWLGWVVCCWLSGVGRQPAGAAQAVWTGDGRLGVLGFGHDSPLGDERWHDAVEEQAQSAENRAREDAERQYGMAMRRALERNADEVRFVRGLGMGFVRD